jgi:large subunit ribosomal protein L25
VQTLIGTPRNDLKKSAKRQLRASGKIPAVVYGKTVQNTPLHVEERDFIQMVREHGSNAVLKLMWGEGNSTVMVGEVQIDPIKNEIIHIDFNQVNMNRKIKTEIPIEWINEEESPGVKEGGVLQKQYRTIEVQCLPSYIPESFSVDLSPLGIGDSVTIGDLALEEGVEIQLPDDSVLVSILAPTLETDPEEPQIEEDVEPEIVDARNGPGMDEAK